MTEVVVAPSPILSGPSSSSEDHDDIATSTSKNNNDWLSFSQNTDIGKLAKELLKRERLVDWATTVLAEGLVEVVIHRRHNANQTMVVPINPPKAVRIPLDEVVGVIDFGNHKEDVSVTMAHETNIEQIRLPERIQHLLRDFVSVVSEGLECLLAHS